MFNKEKHVVLQGKFDNGTWFGGRQGDLDGGTWHGGRQGDLDGGTWHGGRQGDLDGGTWHGDVLKSLLSVTGSELSSDEKGNGKAMTEFVTENEVASDKTPLS